MCDATDNKPYGLGLRDLMKYVRAFHFNNMFFRKSFSKYDEVGVKYDQPPPANPPQTLFSPLFHIFTDK